MQRKRESEDYEEAENEDKQREKGRKGEEQKK